MSADIRNAEVRTFDDKTAAIELVLRIHDLKHLDKVVRSVRGVAGVLDVERQAVSR
jgi:(p)ppGpp synthase/HD superfamily hydrolase